MVSVYYLFQFYTQSLSDSVRRRDEQYRIMWNELETLVKTHVETSERHQQVLECISACRSKPPEEEERKKRGRKREDKEEKTEKNGKESEEKVWTQDTERFEGFIMDLFCHSKLYKTSFIIKSFSPNTFSLGLFVLSLLLQTEGSNGARERERE